MNDINVASEVGTHVLVGHYSNLRSALRTSTGTHPVKYLGKRRGADGRDWHTFKSVDISFACRDYTRKCPAFSFVGA